MFLIGLFGRFGAVFATLGGGVTMAGMYFVWSNREYQVPYSWKRFFSASLFLLTFMTSLSYFQLHLSVRLLLWVTVVSITGKTLLENNEFIKMKNYLQMHFVK